MFLEAVIAAQKAPAGAGTAKPDKEASGVVSGAASANPASTAASNPPPDAATGLHPRPLGLNPQLLALNTGEPPPGSGDSVSPVARHTGSSLLPQIGGASEFESVGQVPVRLEPAGPAAVDLAKDSGKNGRSDRSEFAKWKENSTPPGPDAVNNHGALNGKPTPAAADSPKPPAPVVDTVAGSIIARSELVQREGATEFHLRLEPPELGSVHIHLTATDQGISARMYVHEPSARQLIQNQLESLRQRFQQAGLTLGRFDVAGQGGGAARQGREQGWSFAGQPFPEGGPEHTGPAATVVVRSWLVQMVDVVV